MFLMRLTFDQMKLDLLLDQVSSNIKIKVVLEYTQMLFSKTAGSKAVEVLIVIVAFDFSDTTPSINCPIFPSDPTIPVEDTITYIDVNRLV